VGPEGAGFVYIAVAAFLSVLICYLIDGLRKNDGFEKFWLGRQ
jgi:hypothetical protein